tara:strand:+ start:207 stop:440 length:234 start_codon:yes stop_codon:yes gene_type:complete
LKKRTKIDARGAHCPGPLMELIAGLRLVDKGDEIEILSNDRGSLKDIPVWVEKAGHALGNIEELQEHCSIVVEKVKT